MHLSAPYILALAPGDLSALTGSFMVTLGLPLAKGWAAGAAQRLLPTVAGAHT